MATQENLELAQQLYVAYYGRPADAAGLAFWAEEIEANGIDAAISAFGNSSEYTARFGDLGNEELVNGIYQQAFGRDADAEGLAFYVEKLESGELDLATIALTIVQNATDTDAPDATTLATKVAAANLYTEAAGDAHSGTAADEYAAGILAGITAETDVEAIDPAEWVAGIPAAEDEGEDAGEPAVPGETVMLTQNADRLEGTANDDTFIAPITTVNFANGNTLNTGDAINGNGGNNTLQGEIINDGFFSSGLGAVRPTTENVQNISLNAIETSASHTVTLNAANMYDVENLWSKDSNAHLTVQDITTLTSSGQKRATDELTFRMDHTSNSNSTGQASDLTVYFDENYILPRTDFGESGVVFRIMNQDSYDQNEGQMRLDGVYVNRMEFELDGQRFDIAQYIDEDPLGDGDEFQTEQQLVAHLNDVALPALIADNPESAEALSSLEFTIGNNWNDGNQNRIGQEIVLTASNQYTLNARDAWLTIDQAENVPDSYASNRIERADRFVGEDNEVISTNVELHKVGRGSEGGNVLIGGKSQSVDSKGIPVFNVDILGADDKPSNVGWLGTTNDDLDRVTISTHDDYVDGDTVASLTVRNGLGTVRDGHHSDVSELNANGFLGDLTLGGFFTDNADFADEDFGLGAFTGAARLQNVTEVFATGGGDVEYWANYDQLDNYTVTTGAGDDVFNIVVDGDAVDTIGSGLALNAGDGQNAVFVRMDTNLDSGASQETMAQLDNLSIKTGADEDYVELIGYGNFDIATGASSDTVYINSIDDTGSMTAAKGEWTVGNETGAQTWEGRVLYNATVQVSFAGFESAGIRIPTDRDGKFIAKQTDINAAIIEAIARSPELSQLLETEFGTGDQQLIINSLVEGDNDLRINVNQPQVVNSGATGNQVNLGNGDLNALRDGLIESQVVDSSASATDVANAIVSGGLLNDGTSGSAYLAAQNGGSDNETNVVNHSTINMGSGSNNLVTLNSNEDSAHTLEFTEAWGKVSVVNFFDADGTVGNHVLDFSEYLTSTTSSSGSASSAVPVDGSSVDANAGGLSFAANQVAVVNDFARNTSQNELWSNLDAAGLQAALNGTEDFGNISSGSGNGQNIVMIENDLNNGEYKVFHVDATGSTNNVELLGVIDFGASIDGDVLVA
ncbi:DUF4214 domain-containing protein [Vreelandella zhaodongensis]|uniref:DUF4214 domain-containing protein n=1 Tax=Vreelandella zhaodongensis TaxID=1176240 RepID=UPI003EC0F360